MFGTMASVVSAYSLALSLFLPVCFSPTLSVCLSLSLCLSHSVCYYLSSRLTALLSHSSLNDGLLPSLAPSWIYTEEVYLQRLKLLPSRRMFCVHHTAVHQCTVSLPILSYVSSCNLPPALLTEWQYFLHTAAVTRRWNGYRNKSQHRKLTPEKKILPPLLPGFEPATFRSRVCALPVSYPCSPLFWCKAAKWVWCLSWE